MSDNYVIVHRTYDPYQADMLGDILRDNGIYARVLGTRHGALIGAAQHIMQMHIEVPHAQAGQATDFLETFFDGNGEALLEQQEGLVTDDEDEDPAPDRDTGPAMRRPLFAGGSTLLIFGGSHLYAGRPWTALLLAVGQVVALLNVLSQQWQWVATGMIMFFTILLLDLIGGQLAVRAWNRQLDSDDQQAPIATSVIRQLATGAIFVAVAGAIGSFIGPHIPQPERQNDQVFYQVPAAEQSFE